MTPDQLQQLGVHSSSIHIDFGVGSSDVTIAGITADGSEDPLVEHGEWAFPI